jgi:hypothetical protein
MHNLGVQLALIFTSKSLINKVGFSPAHTCKLYSTKSFNVFQACELKNEGEQILRSVHEDIQRDIGSKQLFFLTWKGNFWCSP